MKVKVSTCLLGVATMVVLGCAPLRAPEDKFGDRLVQADSPYENLMEKFPPNVTVKSVSTVKYAYRAMQGSFSQHRAAIDALLPIAGKVASPAILAVYPNDPDLVAESDLFWQIGLELSEELLAQPDLSLRQLDESLVATLVSTVRETPADGKLLLAWIDLNGYVQTQPTMMRYTVEELQRDRDNPVVEILIPVAKRSHF